MHLLRGRWQRACTRCQMFIFPFRTSVAPSREASHLILASLDNSPWVSSAQAQPTRSLSAGTSPGSNHCSVPYLDSHHLKKEGMAGGGIDLRRLHLPCIRYFTSCFPFPKSISLSQCFILKYQPRAGWQWSRAICSGGGLMIPTSYGWGAGACSPSVTCFCHNCFPSPLSFPTFFLLN